MKPSLTKTPVDVISSRRTVKPKPYLDLTEGEMKQFLYATMDRSTVLRDIIRTASTESAKRHNHSLTALRTMRKKVLAASKKELDIL